MPIVLAFILFWAVALSLSAGHTRAYAVSLPTLATEAILPDSAASSPASFRTDRTNQAIHKAQTRPDQARLLLSVAFAAIVAFNLGFGAPASRLCLPAAQRVEEGLTGSRRVFSPPLLHTSTNFVYIEFGCARPSGRRMMVSKATLKSRVVVITGLAMALATGAAVLTDLLLNRGFGNALGASRPGLSFDTVTAKRRHSAPPWAMKAIG